MTIDTIILRQLGKIERLLDEFERLPVDGDETDLSQHLHGDGDSVWRTRALAAEAENAALRLALAAMLIPFEGEECRHDHHGYCQAHFLEEHCCVAKARDILSR